MQGMTAFWRGIMLMLIQHECRTTEPHKNDFASKVYVLCLMSQFKIRYFK